MFGILKLLMLGLTIPSSSFLPPSLGLRLVSLLLFVAIIPWNPGVFLFVGVFPMFILVELVTCPRYDGLNPDLLLLLVPSAFFLLPSPYLFLS